MTCGCGYKGSARKMAFDVDEAYLYLKENGEVYTIRPAFSQSPRPAFFINVHLHRKHQWTGEEGVKRMIVSGRGKEDLKKWMIPFVARSGFSSVEEWMGKLIMLHGDEVTTKSWALYKVILSKGQTTLNSSLEMGLPLNTSEQVDMETNRLPASMGLPDSVGGATL